MNTQLMIPDLDQQLAKAREGIANSELLASTFAPHFVAFREQAQAAMQVQPDEPKKAGAIRKTLKAIRVAAEKDRKALKEDALRTGKAIDGYHAILEHALVPIENAMREIEEAEERREAARRAAVCESRRAALCEFADPAPYIPVLADMPEKAWEDLLVGAKAAKAAAEQAERDRLAKIEADRIAAEAAARAERERLEAEAAAAREAQRLAEEAARVEREKAAEAARIARAERERLEAIAAAERKKAEDFARAAKVEADRVAAAEAAAKAEQARKDMEAAAVLRKEREAAAAEIARLQREAEAKAEAERAAEAERRRAAARAAAAPDREKMAAFAKAIGELEMPAMETDRARVLAGKVKAEIDAMAARILAAAEGI